MKKFVRLLFILSILLLSLGKLFAVDLQNIPPELLEKAKQSPELVQQYLNNKNNVSTKPSLADRNENIKSNYNSLLNGDFKTNVLKDGDIIIVQNKIEKDKEKVVKAKDFDLTFNKLTVFGAEIFNFDYTNQIPDQNVNVDDNYKGYCIISMFFNFHHFS